MPRFLVGQRHSEFATLARVEGMHMARHIVRRKPRSYSVRVKKSLVDGLAPGLDNSGHSRACSLGTRLSHVSAYPLRTFSRSNLLVRVAAFFHPGTNYAEEAKDYQRQELGKKS